MSTDIAVAPQEAIGATLPGGARGVLEFDAQRYLPELNDLEISEAQKLELLGVLWSIMRSFVELGLDVKRCEQLLPMLGPSGCSDVHCTFNQTETLSTASEMEASS